MSIGRGGRRVVVGRDELDLGGEVAERLVEHRPHLGVAVWPGSVRMSTCEVDAVGDHVGLGAAVDDRRRERRVGAGVELAGHARPAARRTASTKRVGVEQRADELVGEVHALEEPPPDVVDLGRGPVLGEPLDDLGRGDERVVGLVAAGEPWPGVPCTRSCAPVAALLADDHRQLHARWGSGSGCRPTR